VDEIKQFGIQFPGHAMSAGEKFFHLADVVTDRLNPILVKETRQALKSRQFIITFMLLLTVAWLISVFGIMFNGPAIEYGSAGRMFFGWYVGVLGFATLFIVPFGAFRSMLNERDQNTFELLSISTLSPRQIVSGKLLSSLVQVFIYYSAIAPFIAFTSLLQGFDLPLVILLLTGGLLWSVFVSMVAIMLSTLANSRQWQAINTIGMLALLLWQMGMAFGFGGMAIAENVPFDSEEFWWAICCMVVGTCSYLVLAQQIAVSRLTFESGNRSSGIRIVSSIQFWLVWVGVFGYGCWYGASSIDDEVIFALAMMSTIHWVIAGLIFSTESEDISRRVRRCVPQSRNRRLLYSVWLPGGRRGLLLLTLHLAALVAIARLPLWPQWVSDVLMPLPVWDEWVSNAVTAMALYAFIYVGFGSAVGRLGQLVTPEFRPAHARVLTLLLAALAMIAPYLPTLFGITRRFDRQSLVQVTNPFWTVDRICSSHSDTPLFIVVLSGAAAIVLVFNLKALFAGVSDVLTWQSVTASGSPMTNTESTDAAFPG
jgi:hypothetical protein